jgi:hypothetical protein
VNSAAAQATGEAGTGLVRQPHGGALLPGGAPGNRGGRNYPSRVRAIARKALRRALPELAKIAAGEAVRTEFVRNRDRGKARTVAVDMIPAPRERVAAAVALEHIARAPALNLDDVRLRLQAQNAVLREELQDQPALLERVLSRFGDVWR